MTHRMRMATILGLLAAGVAVPLSLAGVIPIPCQPGYSSSVIATYPDLNTRDLGFSWQAICSCMPLPAVPPDTPCSFCMESTLLFVEVDGTQSPAGYSFGGAYYDNTNAFQVACGIANGGTTWKMDLGIYGPGMYHMIYTLMDGDCTDIGLPLAIVDTYFSL